MTDKTKLKYIAVKPKGFAYYIWFETEKVSTENYKFIGVDGWGRNGAVTSIECKDSEIDSYIYSNELQYV